MSALLWLIPVAFLLGLTGIIAFFWSVKTGQFDDPDGDSSRILQEDDHPLL